MSIDFKMRKGFTFFELMLVIVIIGIVYALLIQNFAFGKIENETLELSNIPSYLRKHFVKEKDLVTLKCMDNCSTCKVFINGEENNETKNLFEKYTSPKAYVFQNGYFEDVEFLDVFDEYKSISVCFEYNIYPNGSSDKLVLEYKDKVYMYDNFLEKTKLFSSIDDAQEYLEKQKDEAKE